MVTERADLAELRGAAALLDIAASEFEIGWVHSPQEEGKSRPRARWIQTRPPWVAAYPIVVIEGPVGGSAPSGMTLAPSASDEVDAPPLQDFPATRPAPAASMSPDSALRADGRWFP